MIEEGENNEGRRTYRNFIGEREDLSSLSLSQLRGIAKELGIPSNLRKENTLQALKAHQIRDWKAFKHLIQDPPIRKKAGSNGNFRSKETFLEEIFQDLPIFLDISIPEIFSETFKKLTASPALADITRIKSVILKRRLSATSKEEKEPSNVKKKRTQGNQGFLPDYYTSTTTNSFHRRAETYVTYTTLNPISSHSEDLFKDFFSGC